MLRLFVRRSNDVAYFSDDAARELEGLRDGGPGWWLRGEGDTRDVRDVARVFSSTDRSAVQGYDIVVAAPRPISILLALDPEHGRGVVDAHRASVASSMAYLEERGLVVRPTRDGERVDEAARWERMVSFTHGLNRHGEPHLHDHVLVGARPEGSSSVLDSRSLFVHAPAADALYRASLRLELAQRTPWTSWRSFQGVEHVAGLDEGYRSLWGGHHDGRGAKVHWRRSEAVTNWTRDLTRFQPERIIDTPSSDRALLNEHSFSGALEGRHVVTRRDVVAAWANAAVFGADPRQVSDNIDRLYPQLAHSRGVRESAIGVGEARMIALVRERGARPLRDVELAQWHQRSRERSRADRSR